MKSKAAFKEEFKRLSNRELAEKLSYGRTMVAHWKTELEDAREEASGYFGFGASDEEKQAIDAAKDNIKNWQTIVEVAEVEIEARKLESAQAAADLVAAQEKVAEERGAREKLEYEERAEIMEGTREGKKGAVESALSFWARSPGMIAGFFGLGGAGQSGAARAVGLLRLVLVGGLVLAGAFVLRETIRGVYGASVGAARFASAETGRSFERVGKLAKSIPGGLGGLM